MDISELSRDEQFQLLDQLWDHLGRDPKALPLTDEQREELDRRLDALEGEGPVGIPWDELIAQIRARSR
jgi:putative addiction module component (TIGR02574 family)